MNVMQLEKQFFNDYFYKNEFETGIGFIRK